MLTLQHILNEKEKQQRQAVVTVRPDCTIVDAVRTLCQHRIGALLVVNEQQHLIGILTERDVLQQCCNGPGRCGTMTAGEAMTREVIAGRPGDKVEEALQVMTGKHIRHLPVVEGENILGIVSIGDILRHLYKQDELRIRYLSDYLGGTYGLKVY